MDSVLRSASSDTCHILYLPLILRFHLFLWVSDDEGVEGNEVVGEIQKTTHPFVAFLERIEGCLYSSKLQTFSHEENVLGGGGAILNPKLLFLAFQRLA